MENVSQFCNLIWGLGRSNVNGKGGVGTDLAGSIRTVLHGFLFGNGYQHKIKLNIGEYDRLEQSLPS